MAQEHTMRRRAAVAGSWYPDDPAVLGAAVDACLEGGRPAPAPLVGLVAPHAGLAYSGSIAGAAYASLRGQAPEAIVLVGPSHYVPFDGVAVWPEGRFDTPLGALAVEAGIAGHLLAHCPAAVDLPAAHAREHSLEMQLPFLARCCPDAPIVPVVMGWQERDTIRALADGLVAACAGRRVVLVASSDLSHFFDAATAARLDRRSARLVAALDDEGVLAELEAYPPHERGRFVMCGGGPVVAVMRAARALGAEAARVLRLGHSGEVSGDVERVVGYMAAVFTAALPAGE
jgi:hypothetical protein